MNMCHKKTSWILFAFILLLSACVPIEEKLPVPFDTSLRNDAVRRVYEMQRRQEIDSLQFYIKSEDPSIRYAVARAFASIQDSSSLDLLLPLLNDPQVHVRAMAAEAVGQIGSSKAEVQLTAAFDGRDSARMYEEANGAILEAMGKIGTAQFLHALGTISTYQPGDTLLLLGQVRGIYRYGLRNMTDPDATATMVKY